MPTFTRWIILGSLFALVALIAYWNLVLAPPQAAPVALLLAFYLLPLLAVLPGLLTGRTGAYVATALVSLLYLTHALVILSGPNEHSWPALTEAGLALTLMISASLQSRWLRMVEAGLVPSDE